MNRDSPPPTTITCNGCDSIWNNLPFCHWWCISRENHQVTKISDKLKKFQ